MPNTPALVGRGISVAVAGTKATPADLKHTLKLFKAVGEAVSITGEDLLDAVTALSGSGPAFVYLFAESLIEGGDRKSTRLNSSHLGISYAVFCLKKKT